MEYGVTAHKVSPVERYIDVILKACLHGSGWLYVAIMIMTTVHVIGRYGFTKSVPGLIELTSYFIIVAVFLQGAYIMLRKGHVAIGIICDRFSERTQAIIDSVTYILCFAFAVIAAWQTIVRAIVIMDRGLTSGTLHIPVYPAIIIVGVGWGLFGVAIAVHLVHFIHRAVKR